MKMFGKLSQSQSLIALAGVDGLSSGDIDIYLFFQRVSSISSNSGDGKSPSYILATVSRLGFFEHRILGTRASREDAIIAAGENLVKAHDDVIKKGDHYIFF